MFLKLETNKYIQDNRLEIPNYNTALFLDILVNISVCSKCTIFFIYHWLCFPSPALLFNFTDVVTVITEHMG